jgi:hypothetical protein
MADATTLLAAECQVPQAGFRSTIVRLCKVAERALDMFTTCVVVSVGCTCSMTWLPSVGSEGVESSTGNGLGCQSHLLIGDGLQYPCCGVRHDGRWH